MQITKGPWESSLEADAFIAGVEYVNDSAISIPGDQPRRGADGLWYVDLFDADAERTDE